jgi:hypothetical protein
MPFSEKNNSRPERKVTTNAGIRGKSHGDQPEGFGTRVHQRFAALDSSELTLPERSERPRAADLSK